jgi:hypothetical protein
MQNNQDYSYGKSLLKAKAETTPIEDLLWKQRKGQFLTFHEKEVIKKYAEENRKKNKK